MEVFLSSILQISIQNKCKRIDIFVVCFQFLHIHTVVRIRVALLVIEEDVRYVFLSDNTFPTQRNILHVKILQRKRFQSAGKMVAKLVLVVVEKSEALMFEVKTYAIRTPCQKGIRCFCHIIFHDCFSVSKKVIQN